MQEKSVKQRAGEWRGGTDVRVMDSSPPPAPARACAILSPCWAAEIVGAVGAVVLDD